MPRITSEIGCWRADRPRPASWLLSGTALAQLQLCEDLCNNSKHYHRKRKARVSATLGFQRQYVPEAGRYGERWAVVTPTPGFESVDLVTLIVESSRAWERFCQPRLPAVASLDE
jgi:hypothetical protein